MRFPRDTKCVWIYYCSQSACTTYLRVCTTYLRVFVSPIIATTCLSWIKFFVHQCNSRKTEKIRQPWHHCQTKHVQIRAIKTVVVAHKDRLARFATKVIEWSIDQVGGTITNATNSLKIVHVFSWIICQRRWHWKTHNMAFVCLE